jgi:hypothetical protein
MAHPLRRSQRNPRNRSTRFVVAALLAGLCACASQAPASQADGASAPSTSVEQITDDSTTGGAGAETTALNACDLLTPDELAELEVGGPPRSSDSSVCRWSGADYEVGVTVLPDLAIDEIQSTTDLEPLTIGSHDAVRYTGKFDSCLVALELTDTSVVNTLSTAPGNLKKACKLAKKAAKAVEPELP